MLSTNFGWRLRIETLSKLMCAQETESLFREANLSSKVRLTALTLLTSRSRSSQRSVVKLSLISWLRSKTALQ